jgi:chromatin segregation and condensation protein Rec8/ScpA/Scc1 (kleisin family)
LSPLLAALRYETTSKRVNVRKLKHDMWSLLEENTSSSSDKVHSSGELSFHSLLSEMSASPSMRQSDASLSFYFISLLHLANEKVRPLSSSFL